MDLLSESDSDRDENITRKSYKKKSDKVRIKDKENESQSLIINKKFAEKFEREKRFKELQAARDLSLNHSDDERDGSQDESDSESETEDDDAEALSSTLELEILKTINSIRRKDPKIYDASTKWFESVGGSKGSEGALDDDEDAEGDDEGEGRLEVEEKAGSSKHKKQTYKELVREQLLRDGAGSEDEEEDLRSLRKKAEKASRKDMLAYDEEQNQLRKTFLAMVDGVSGQEEDEESGSDSGGLFTRSTAGKSLSTTAEAKAKAAIERELETMKVLGKINRSAICKRDNPNEIDDVSGAMANDNDNDNTEDFLSEYLAKQKWKERVIYGGNDSDSEYDKEEEELEEVDRFESKYNFRFEELQAQAQKLENSTEDRLSRSRVSFAADAELPVSLGLGLGPVGHARTVEGSLRRVDDKRKVLREKQKEKKLKERRQKEEELKRLKNLKRQELQDRLEQIRLAGGISVSSKHKKATRGRDREGEEGYDEDIAFIDEALLDEDWDPEKYEAQMQAQFGDEYYSAAVDEDEERSGAFLKSKEWERLELEDQDPREEEEEEEDYEAAYYGEIEDEVARDKGGDKNGDRDTNANADDSKRSKKDKARKGNTEGGLDGNSYETNSLMEELYKLDYEDIVAGIPCRFKYRQVAPESFGLTAEEILLADDSELSRFVSLKKLSTYREKRQDDMKVMKKRKRLRAALREREREREREKEGTSQKNQKSVLHKSKENPLVSTGDPVPVPGADFNSDDIAKSSYSAMVTPSLSLRSGFAASNDEGDEDHSISPSTTKRKRKRNRNKLGSEPDMDAEKPSNDPAVKLTANPNPKHEDHNEDKRLSPTDDQKKKKKRSRRKGSKSDHTAALSDPIQAPPTLDPLCSVVLASTTNENLSADNGDSNSAATSQIGKRLNKLEPDSLGNKSQIKNNYSRAGGVSRNSKSKSSKPGAKELKDREEIQRIKNRLSLYS